VKIQGNLPMTDERKRTLSINRPDSVDVVFAQGALTATGGHQISLTEMFLQSKECCPGHTMESLKDYRYYTIDSEAEMEKK
jgi:hypothetical protein